MTKQEIIVKTLKRAKEPMRLSELAKKARTGDTYAHKIVTKHPKITRVGWGKYAWGDDEEETEQPVDATTQAATKGPSESFIRSVVEQVLAGRERPRRAGTGIQKEEAQKSEWARHEISGVTIHLPKGYHFTRGRRAMFENHIKDLEGTFRRELSDIYVNDDWDSETSAPHNVTYKFKH